MGESGSAGAKLESVRAGDRSVLRVTGRLDAESTPALWTEARRLADAGTHPAEVDASGVVSCDSAGAAWLVWLGAPVSGANRQVAALLELVRPRDGPPAPAPKTDPEMAPPRELLVARLGHAAEQSAAGLHFTVAYVGTLIEGVATAVRHPRSLRKKDLFLYMARTGSEALPIVALITFLVGVIIAYQAWEMLHQFGYEIFVADTVALSMVMELGPLMTAIVMAGRSGSAFAAEIGTMKVNEEVDALDTLGLDSTRFLVMPKFIAMLLTMPVLCVFASFCGIAGGLLIGVTVVDLPMHVYLHETVQRLTVWRAMQGMIKGEAYAVVIAAVGCLRGLQTKTGAQGVGLSATSAVVSGVFLIIVVDAVLTVLFHHV
jgi:phospholipid/cholesterol/gamma-HCH transport system permease protein